MLRAVALLSLLLVHLGVFGDPDGPAHAVVNAVFAVICGISLVQGTQVLARTRGWRAVLLWGVLRGMAILILGLLLGLLPGDAGGELASFGIAIVIAAAFVTLPSWIVALGGVIVAAIGAELGARWGGPEMRAGAVDPDITMPDGLVGTSADIFLLGDVPALVVTVQILVGIIVARLFIAARDRREIVPIARTGLIVGAVILVVVLALNIPDLVVNRFLSWSLLGGSAVAIVLLSLSSLVWDRNLVTPHRFWVRVMQAAGSAPMTAYVMHAVVSAFPLAPVYSAAIQVAVTLAVAVVMVVWHLHGPVETAIGAALRWVTTTLVPFDFALLAGERRDADALSR